jgi:large subunit ribosomal protein L30
MGKTKTARSIQIQLIHSLNHQKPNHKKTAKCLGLRKINQTVIKENTPAMRGMARAIAHLVKVEEIE